MFSLSRAGHAPAILGRLTRSGTPLYALLLSSLGIAIAAVLNVLNPETSFTMMMAISMFGALFTWMMIFITHYFFRRKWNKDGGRALSFRLPGYPVLTLAGALAMLLILVTTSFTEIFRMTLVFGVPFLLILTVLYYLLARPRTDQPATVASAASPSPTAVGVTRSGERTI